ncbi:MAG: TonB-dependent receptor [Bacteroidales bacterium]|nr:TonB-dependent receptor [Bacteroidales bacterium]
MKRNFMFQVLLTLVVGLFLSVDAFAQQIAVKGIVKDATGEPVIGANVIVKGTTNGTITDFDGIFQLNANQGDIIVISFIGYLTQELPAAAEMNVILKDDTETLDEVVVIGYGVAKKNDLTGSVTAIKPDEMNKGLVTNAQDMMQGKIAGVNVTSSGGTPGGGATIRIRGGSSLNASNDPLIVIDGLAMDNNGVKGLSNPLSMVNPADIESFTVLKDASATAIYGSRGSNGVIIITTKKGRTGQKPSVSYNGNISLNMKKKTIDVMDGDQFRDFVINKYGADSDAAAALGTANTNWQDEIYRTAISHDHNITVSGGLQNMPYRVSLGFTGQDGILKTSDFNRYTASVNLSPSFFDDHLKVNVNAKGMIAKTRYANTGAVSAAVYMDPTQPVKSSDEKYKNFGGYYQWTQTGDALNDPTWPLTWNGQATQNPVSLLDLKNDKATSKSFVGNLEFDYKVHGLEDLRLHMNMGGDFSTGKQTTVTSPMSPENIYYGWDGWDKIDKYNMSFNAYAQYYKDFNEKHHFDIMGGYEWQHFHSSQSYDGWGIKMSTNTEYDNTNIENNYMNRSFKDIKTENYLVSFFGRANYTLLDRYMLTATVRYDGSSRFKDHWALFPSFAFGWRIKDEAFLKDVDAVSDLKLRLGYGQTGQQEGIGNYNYFASYNVNVSPDSYYPLLGNGTLYRPDAYNQELTWETTTTYNVGLDFGFANQRFTGSVDYYYRKTTDLLNTVYVPAGSNFRNQVTSNIGSLKNTGVEIALNWKAIQTEDWYWDLGFNLTYNENKITELIGEEGYFVPTGGISSGTGNNCQAHTVGQPASSFYVYQQAYDQNGLPLEGVFVDRNGDGQITTEDKYFYKNPTAPWTGGFTSKLQYKAWDFSFSLRGSVGNYVFNDLQAGASNMSTVWSYNFLGNRPLDVIEKNWQTWDYVLSDYFVQNASFLKCDNITLGYSFENFLKGANYKGISGRVYATLSNVFTITNYKGIDPEVSGGIDNNIYPRPFSAMIGVNLNF